MPGPVESVGIGADTAQLIGGGSFAVGMREYLRPAAGWKQRLLASGVTLLASSLFGHDVARWLGVSLSIGGSLAGLACIGVSEAVLRAADKLDIGAYLPGRKST